MTTTTDSFPATMDDGAQILIRRAGNPNGTRLFLSHGNGFAIDGYRVFWEPLLADFDRSEEHTSELQSQSNLVCRLLLEKKQSHTPPRMRLPCDAPPLHIDKV